MAKLEIDTDELISVDEAAVQLNIGIATAWRWIRDGKLKTTKLFGRTLVRKDDLSNISKTIKE